MHRKRRTEYDVQYHVTPFCLTQFSVIQKTEIEDRHRPEQRMIRKRRPKIQRQYGDPRTGHPAGRARQTCPRQKRAGDGKQLHTDNDRQQYGGREQFIFPRGNGAKCRSAHSTSTCGSQNSARRRVYASVTASSKASGASVAPIVSSNQRVSAGLRINSGPMR